MLKRTGGARFDPAEGFVFFIAGLNIDNAASYHPWTLMAANDVTDDGVHLREFEQRITDVEAKLLLDSGIFWLANRHAEAHGLTMDEALSAPPENVDGFEKLFARYVSLATTYEDRLWGYVELDQGGVAGKRRTRARLEALGLRPIPVYHPITDGFDYFDELLAEYDRICIGNVVMADASIRRALLAMVWERRRRHDRPVWLHALGYTPNPLFNAYPFNSSDSSSHLYSLRFGASMCMGRAMLAQFGTLEDEGFSYEIGAADHVDSDTRGLRKKTALLSWIARTEVQAWRSQWADLERVVPDVTPWPAPFPGERPPTPAA